ncbi:hypothetical protein IB275_18385 [Pseudomonas sp. PDM21]|uniref:DUF5801 repeats-in-toxin domain-containing protein n=1 Tax=Pseudomonas sp. PDM21 TaxID=2769257 RepID=UPI00178509AE|nr:DUF5801 repeats-in-toxin domain-containing protein [Pseudomonas sp. PDM21]MBD9672560.1 hypothetical protein [Pseudomonas sp. PDM21]
MTLHKKIASPTRPTADDTNSPSVTTDQDDYAPGSTAIITASGFTAGSTVKIEVDHATNPGADGVWGTADDVLNTSAGAGHDPWYVTDGGAGDLDGQINGSITTSWYVDPDDSAGARFLLSASSDGATATATFTDAGPVVSATGVTVSLDETTGLQNATATASPAGDANDNDILLASLPAAFTARLTALGAGTASGAALSGYTGAAGNTGSNAFTISAAPGGAITDILFTGSNGAALNGLDSGLDTLAGQDILLYTDATNNNVLVGRAGGPAGAIVFAAYIEETGSPVSGGKIWTVEYQPLKHPVTSNPDDTLDLLNKVFIGTSQDLTFSLADAPSGQNLFLMFTTATPTTVNDNGVTRITDPTIIATGRDPANQSTGANITTGDTINTSQAGGPTTFGTNNQMITEQEGIRFTFVTGARQNVTIPNLDQNEADVEANIDFTQMFNAKTASFDVVQLQSGKSAIVKLSAFSTAVEAGNAFIDGYAGDATVAITNVRVLNSTTGAVLENSNGSVNDPGITIIITGGVATITGVLAGYKIEYTTTADHNRVLVENGSAVGAKGNDHAAFDIGGFKLLQVSTATAEIGSKMIFEDDGPSISTTGTEPTLTVDESVLTTDASQSFAANFTSAFGADGAGTLTYALSVIAGASGLVDTATGQAVNLAMNGAVVEGRTAISNDLVFTVSVAANGTVTLDQQRAIVHANTSNPDDSKTLTSDDLVKLTATKTDGDGDSAQATLNIGQNLVFKDDGPNISTTGVEPVMTVDESVLATDSTQNFAANFTSAFGADGAGTLTYALGVIAGASGLTDTATGEAVNLSMNGAVVEGRTATTNQLVFTVSVAANGDVTLDQQRAIVHADTSNPDDSRSLTADDLVKLTATKTDGDGDSAQATLNIGQNLVFKDDGPNISTTGVEPVMTVDETVLATNATANFAGNFTSGFGADGAGTLTYALSVIAGASGLTDTATGQAVNLAMNGAVVEGRTAISNDLVFTVSVAANGDVTLDQQRAIVHANTSDPDDSRTLTSDNLVKLTATKTDGDGDSAQATLNIGQNLVFKDDGPNISTTGVEPVMTVDESVLATDSTQNFAANFTSGFGADGAGTLTYALSVITGGSGLTDTATGEAVNLSMNGAVAEGRTVTTNLLVFKVSVAANGDVTLDQQRAIVHADTSNPDDSRTLTSDDLVKLTATKTDQDGDSAQATLNIGQNLVFKDAGPSISPTGTEPVLTVDDSDLTTNALQAFSANFLSSFGADGAGTLTYTLGCVSGASGLTDTATGQSVVLSLNGTVVEGRCAISNDLVFTVSVNANGDVTLDQQRAIVHANTSDPDDSRTLTSDNLVTLTGTKTDKDGDSAQTTLNIGQNLIFKDDGPTISTTGSEPTLTVDETVLATNATANFAANFTSGYGADGSGTLTYALSVVAGASGLVDTATGQAVNLSVNNGVVEGRTAVSNVLVFTVSAASNGDVTLDQMRAVFHANASDPNDTRTLTSDSLVKLTATITDKDGDSAQATLNIGQNLIFRDDGPALAFGNIVGTGSTIAQTGYWDHAFGADGSSAAGLDIVLANGQFTLVRPNGTTTTGTGTLTETSPSPDANGAFHFAGTLTGDFDNNASTANTSVDYTLTALADGTYTLDLVQGFSSTLVLSTANGQLGAGGPDPVQTLTIGTDAVVFFAAKALAPQTGSDSILTGIGLGLTDPTEAQLQTTPLPSYIDDQKALNVSTSGIGVKNNVLQGSGAGITAGDDSFVANPQTLLTSVKVFIDNSVGGYDPTSESLYYVAYYDDGTTSGAPIKVLAANLQNESGGQKSFTVQTVAGKLIDAIQLTMAEGMIKVPTIQFIKQVENLASDVKLSFNATVTDKDGDAATSAFSANLFANKAAGGAFDYVLAGVTGTKEAFNIDLARTENKYQVTGFDTTGQRDKLVLNGDATSTVQNIDNSGANSIVTIHETGGQLTTITLVGVDILNTDIVHGSAT